MIRLCFGEDAGGWKYFSVLFYLLLSPNSVAPYSVCITKFKYCGGLWAVLCCSGDGVVFHFLSVI